MLNGSRRLAQSDSFKSLFLSADELTFVVVTLKRLRSRAVRDGKHVYVFVDGVDGSAIFSLACGDLRQCIDVSDNSVLRQCTSTHIGLLIILIILV